MGVQDQKLIREKKFRPSPEFASGVVFRLYTENKNKPGIEKIVSKFFKGFTLIHGRGYWEGNREESLIIEIVGDIRDQSAIEKLAKEIKRENKQESVLLQKALIDQLFI